MKTFLAHHHMQDKTLKMVYSADSLVQAASELIKAIMPVYKTFHVHYASNHIDIVLEGHTFTIEEVLNGDIPHKGYYKNIPHRDSIEFDFDGKPLFPIRIKSS